MAEYIVEIRNVFEAEDHDDAVKQMIAYLVDNAQHAGYRVYGENDKHHYGVFIDADDIDWSVSADG